ncbi:ribbon-helix-helix protein, CopG family [Chloroflexi bacterium TSY]|nr:ribbon-helix-helix protein, CopG family [Chloroflexi bacterium TSY]
MAKKQQFNVYLSPELIEQIKLHAAETQQSLSNIAETALHQYLDPSTVLASEPKPAQKDISLMVIVFADDIDASIVFYQMLGLDLTLRSKGGGWAELELGDAVIALH